MYINGIFMVDDSAGAPPGSITPPGSGWGGGLIGLEDDLNVVVYAWEEDPAVTFATLNLTIVVDNRGYTEDLSGAQSAATTLGGDATTLQGAGFKAAFRYWKEDDFDVGLPFDGNWWDTLDPYVQPTIPTVMQTWWDDFNAEIVTNGVIVDYKIHDYEKGMSFFSIDTEANRIAYFEPITVDDGNNPYPFSPNPYLKVIIDGVPEAAYLGDYSDPRTDMFIQEWEQWNSEMRTTFLSSLTNACPALGKRYSNYKDRIQSFEIGNLFDKPNRLPIDQSRFGNISSPQTYLDYNTAHPRTDPEASFTTVRELVNRRRWKTLIHNLNEVESAAASSGRVHPWIAPPGYGADGADTWADADILPFEKLLWRIKMRHLLAMGCDTYILWNPVTNDPNSGTVTTGTHNFMDAYFTGKTVPAARPSGLSITDIDGECIQTESRITNYDDVYAITTVHHATAASPIEPFSQGFCTVDEPLIINTGATGVQELADLDAALVIVYGSEAPPVVYVEKSGFVPVPAPE